LWVFSYGHSEVVKNDALMAAFRHYLAHAAGTEKPFDVRLTFENDANGGAVPRATMGVGDYVVISSAYYARFYRPDAVARHPRQTRAMQAFYAFLRTQEPVAHFAGNGPTIDVYRLRVPVQVGRPRGPGGGR
jgi:hypothetical protein